MKLFLILFINSAIALILAKLIGALPMIIVYVIGIAIYNKLIKKSE